MTYYRRRRSRCGSGCCVGCTSAWARSAQRGSSRVRTRVDLGRYGISLRSRHAAGLRRDGMVITDLGLNLVPLAARRYPGQPASSVLDDDDVNFALGALVYQTDKVLAHLSVPAAGDESGSIGDPGGLISHAMVLDLQARDTRRDTRRDRASRGAPGAVCRRVGRRRSARRPRGLSRGWGHSRVTATRS